MALKIKIYYMDDTSSEEEYHWDAYDLEQDLNKPKTFIRFEWAMVNKKEIQFLTYEVQD